MGNKHMKNVKDKKSWEKYKIKTKEALLHNHFN